MTQYTVLVPENYYRRVVVEADNLEDALNKSLTSDIIGSGDLEYSHTGEISEYRVENNTDDNDGCDYDAIEILFGKDIRTLSLLKADLSCFENEILEVFESMNDAVINGGHADHIKLLVENIGAHLTRQVISEIIADHMEDMEDEERAELVEQIKQI